MDKTALSGQDRDRRPLKPISREQAARQAAARFATDATQAVAHYAALTGRTELLHENGRVELEEEMCALLPGYRHPVHDEHSEHILFFDPDGLPMPEPAQPQPIDPAERGQRAFRAYVQLVRGGGLSGRQALTLVRERYAYPDDLSALAALQTELEVVIRRWQRSAPCMVQTLLDTRWRGLLPSL